MKSILAEFEPRVPRYLNQECIQHREIINIVFEKVLIDSQMWWKFRITTMWLRDAVNPLCVINAGPIWTTADKYRSIKIAMA